MTTITFGIIVCVPVILLAVLLISGIFVIGYEAELYAKELNNPYVNSNFKGWHTEITDYGSIILPEEWEIVAENKTIQILQDGENIAVGALIKGDDALFPTKEAFLGQILKMDVSRVNCDNLHSLLGSSFGKFYINENREYQGYYLNLVNGNGSSLFFCFSSVKQDENELKSKAEAIIYDHKYRKKI